MGLLITKVDTPIYIKGTDIELESVYARVTFEANEDGKTVKASVKTYKDSSFYTDRKEIETSLNLYDQDFVLGENEIQSVDVVLSYVKTRIEEFGYSVDVV